jgi:hypothetical protein
MNLSKKVWLVVVIVIFAIVLGVLFSIYSRQAGERNELSDRLSNAQTLLPGLVDNREDLENQLAQAESSLDDDYNVALTSLGPSTPTSKKVGAVTYSVSSFAVVVNGNIDNILDFIYAIRIGEDFQLPWSADLKSVNIGGSQASMTLDIYSYKG